MDEVEVTGAVGVARDRLLACAARCMAAERGGLDGEDSREEERRAWALFDEAVVAYCTTVGFGPNAEVG